MYWDTSGARHFRESCGKRRGAEVRGGAEEGRSFLLSPQRQLTYTTGGTDHGCERSQSPQIFFLGTACFITTI